MLWNAGLMFGRKGGEDVSAFSSRGNGAQSCGQRNRGIEGAVRDYCE